LICSRFPPDWSSDEAILDLIESIIERPDAFENSDIKISKTLIAVYLAYKDPDVTPDHISAIWNRVSAPIGPAQSEDTQSILDKLFGRTAVPDWFHEYWSTVYDATGVAIGERFEGYAKSLFEHIQTLPHYRLISPEDSYLYSQEKRLRAMAKMWILYRTFTRPDTWRVDELGDRSSLKTVRSFMS